MFYGQAVRFLGRCKTGAFGPKTLFEALFVGQNCQTCLRSGLRGLSPLAPPYKQLTVRYPFFYHYKSFAQSMNIPRGAVCQF